jgi:hypothetical protein
MATVAIAVPEFRRSDARHRRIHAIREEPGNEKRCEDERHQHAVRGEHPVIIKLRRHHDDVGPREPLQHAEERTDPEDERRGIDMGEHQQVTGGDRERKGLLGGSGAHVHASWTGRAAHSTITLAAIS